MVFPRVKVQFSHIFMTVYSSILKQDYVLKTLREGHLYLTIPDS